MSDNRKRLARLLGEVAVHEGLHPTPVDGVEVLRRSEAAPPRPDGLPAEHRHRRPGPEAGLSRRRGLHLRRVQLPRLCPCRCRRSARRRRAPRSPMLIARHRRRADHARRDDARDGRALAAGRPDAAGHLVDPDERGAGRGGHPAPGMPQVPARQPHARPPDGPRDRLPRAPRRAGRGAPCPGQPGRPLRPHRPGREARPRRVREAAQRRGAGEEGRA